MAGQGEQAGTRVARHNASSIHRPSLLLTRSGAAAPVARRLKEAALASMARLDAVCGQQGRRRQHWKLARARAVRGKHTRAACAHLTMVWLVVGRWLG
jgi:hypothetical protein